MQLCVHQWNRRLLSPVVSSQFCTSWGSFQVALGIVPPCSLSAIRSPCAYCLRRITLYMRCIVAHLSATGISLFSGCWRWSSWVTNYCVCTVCVCAVYAMCEHCVHRVCTLFTVSILCALCATLGRTRPQQMLSCSAHRLSSIYNLTPIYNQAKISTAIGTHFFRNSI